MWKHDKRTQKERANANIKHKSARLYERCKITLQELYVQSTCRYGSKAMVIEIMKSDEI